MEKEDVPLLVDWWSDPDFGEYKSPIQTTRAGMEKFLENTVLKRRVLSLRRKMEAKLVTFGISTFSILI